MSTCRSGAQVDKARRSSGISGVQVDRVRRSPGRSSVQVHGVRRSRHMKWRNHAALLEIGASPREVDATPSHSLSVSSSCFPLLINKRIFFHLSTTLYPTDRLTSSASSASSRFLSLARIGLYFEVSTKILGSRTDFLTSFCLSICTIAPSNNMVIPAPDKRIRSPR